MKKPVILVVDDDESFRQVTTSFLKTCFECDLKEASGGDDAVEFIKLNHCDIVLMDIKMPKKSGIPVIKEIKSIRPDTEIVVISGWVSEEVAEEAVAAGATDYIVKPFDIKVAVIKLTNILTKRGQLSLKARKSMPGKK